MGLASCVDDLSSFTQKQIQLTAGMAAPTSETLATTRAGLNIQSTYFNPGEKINIYIKGENGTEVCYPGQFTTEEVDKNTKLNSLKYSDPLYYPVGDEKVNIQAYYPAWVKNTDENFTVKYSQGSEQDYKDSDLMYAERLNQEKTSGEVNLQFSHKLVKFVFNVEGDGTGVTIGDPYLTQVERAIKFDPVTGGVSNYDSDEKDLGNVLLDKGGAIIIPPQTISGKFIGIDMSSVRDGETRTGTAVFSLNSPRTLTGGKVYTVNIVLGHDNVSKNLDGTDYVYPITKWDEDAGVISIAPAGTTGISVADVDDVTYTGDAFTPMPEVKFGEYRVLKSPKDYPEDQADYEYQYFNNTHGGKAIVLVVGKGDYMGFSVATSFTIKPDTAKLKYKSATDEWLEVDGNEANKVTMTYVYNMKVDNPLVEDVGEASIVYNSSNTAVATIDKTTGVVTIVGIGTTTISAHRESYSDWTSADAQYELVVKKRDAGSDTSGDIYVTLDQHGQTYVYDGKTSWKPTVVVKEKYTENGETKETTISASHYTVDYPDPINASEEAKVIVKFKEEDSTPYSGSITKTYKIAKADPKLTVKTSEMYVALPTNTNVTEANRSRTVSCDFGNVEYYFTPSGGTELNSDLSQNAVATVSGTNTNLTITGKTAGDFKLTLKVSDNDNWVEDVEEITVHVVQSLFDYSYTGYSQRWVCPATGTYLLEVWGAQGGSASGTKDTQVYTAQGGAGAKVEGKLALKKGDVLYVNVGQQGQMKGKGYCPYGAGNEHTDKIAFGQDVRYLFRAWNGGGGIAWGLTNATGTGKMWLTSDAVCGGGGATDISLDWKNYNTNSVSSNTDWNTPEHLLTRIIVAGGGGGAFYYSTEFGVANGTSGGAWEAGTMTITTTMTDPGEGGKLNRGGKGAIASSDTERTTAQGAKYTALIDTRPSGWSGSDGIFGDGGYFYCPSEGGGAGGGGWYGGGSAGQHSANGSGAGGSSYAWTSSLASHYPKASSLANTTYYKMYSSSTVKNPSERSFQYITDAQATADANASSERDTALDGKATITCVSITD